MFKQLFTLLVCFCGHFLMAQPEDVISAPSRMKLPPSANNSAPKEEPKKPEGNQRNVEPKKNKAETAPIISAEKEELPAASKPVSAKTATPATAPTATKATTSAANNTVPPKTVPPATTPPPAKVTTSATSTTLPAKTTIPATTTIPTKVTTPATSTTLPAKTATPAKITTPAANNTAPAKTATPATTTTPAKVATPAPSSTPAAKPTTPVNNTTPAKINNTASTGTIPAPKNIPPKEVMPVKSPAPVKLPVLPKKDKLVITEPSEMYIVKLEAGWKVGSMNGETTVVEYFLFKNGQNMDNFTEMAGITTYKEFFAQNVEQISGDFIEQMKPKYGRAKYTEVDKNVYGDNAYIIFMIETEDYNNTNKPQSIIQHVVKGLDYVHTAYYISGTEKMPSSEKRKWERLYKTAVLEKVEASEYLAMIGAGE